METEAEKEAPTPLVTHVNKIFHSIIFFNLRCTSTISNFTIQMDSMRTNLTFPTTSGGLSLNTKKILHCKRFDYEEFLNGIVEAPSSELFITRRMKKLSRPDGFMLYGELHVDFLSTSELLYPNMKIRLRLIRARPNLYMISGNPNVSLGTVDCSLYTRRVALKDDYHKKRMDMLAFHSCGVQLLGNSCRYFHRSCQTKPVHSQKHFQQCSSSSDCYCNENKLCIHWIFY